MSRIFAADSFPLEPGLRLLEASAGTGKTFALAQLVLRLLSETDLSLRQLLVVTFTDAAAAELRDRIGRRLQAALACLEDPQAPAPDSTLAEWLERMRPRAAGLRARLLLALEELDAADITTIHGFCRRTLQRQALEAGQAPGLELDRDGSVLAEQIAHDYWRQQVLPLPPRLLGGLQRRVQGPQALAALLRKLDDDPALQLDPLPEGLTLEEPLAPQLAWCWHHDWQQVLELWPQRAADLEAEFRATAGHWRTLGFSKTTPYSPGARRDRVGDVTRWLADQGPQGDYGALMAAAGGAELLHSYFHPGAFLKVARPIEASAAAEAGQPSTEPSLPQRPLLEAIAAVVDGPAERLLLHAAHWGRAELDRRRRRSGRLGFAQLLEGLDPGEHQSTPLLEAVGQRYGAALIDEFQDTDPIQWRILSRAFRADLHRVVLVGDPKQAIYRFRGGELSTYLQARATAAAGDGIWMLGDNHRSAEPLVAGLNGLMAPGLRRSDLAVPAVRARAATAPLDLFGDGLAVELLWLGQQRLAGQKLPSRSTLERQLPAAIAARTAALLQQGRPQGLSPADVCVLVSSHSQAEAQRQALEGLGLASRLVSHGDVFESPAATALQRLLDALAAPADSNRLRLLAASPLLGWSAGRIAAAGVQTWSELAGRLAELAEHLNQRGLLAVVGGLAEEGGIARLSLGGRLLADLLQCAELVQERLHAGQLGAAAAADWLRRQRLEEGRLVPEAHQPRSDVADAAVSVMTVHRSKGLEYPVVICPYLWQGARGNRAAGGTPGVRWHPPGSGGAVLDLHGNGHWGAGWAARRQQLLDELAELERLAYVAVTRAKRRLVLAWGPAAGQQGNPLHPWLFSAEALPDPDHDPHGHRSDGDWLALLEQELAARELPLQLLHPPGAKAPIQAESVSPAAAAKLSTGPVPERSFDRTWGRSSYSSWTHGSSGSGPVALEEGRETDAVTVEPLVQAGGRPAGGEPWPEDGPLGRFPRGSQAGDCLHRILERLDFRLPLAGQQPLCAAELRRAGIGNEHLPGVLAGLERLRRQPLGGPLGHFHLAELGPRERLNEMNFDLPLAPVRAAGLAAVFAAHPGGSVDGAYARSLAELPVDSQGFLTGSIDLVMRHGERWWVVDWKSNWLGERDGDGRPLHCGPRHYDPTRLGALMAANHYPLQAHLYLVALHRYLRWRLPDYDPERHLGGSLYVFLRGLPEPPETTAGPATLPRPMPPGLFVDQPPLPRLLALDRLLAGGAASTPAQLRR